MPEPPGPQRRSSVSHRFKVLPAAEGSQVGGAGRAPASPRPGRAAPRVTLHLGLGGGARRAGPPLSPSNSSPVARPDPGSQQPPAAQRRALGWGSADWEPEARRRAELGPMGRRPSGRPRPAPPAAPGRRAPAGRDRQTDRRGAPGSPRRSRGGRRAARRRLIPAAPAGGVAERSQPETSGLLQVPACVPSSPCARETSPCDPATFPAFFCPAPPWPRSRVHEPADLHPQGDFASCWAPVSGAVHPPVPRPVVAGVLRIRLLRGLSAAEAVSGCLGKPQGGCLESALERGVEDGWRRENRGAGERRHFAEGHPWGVSLAGKPFLLFLERRRFPDERKCFPGRLLRLLPCHSPLPFALQRCEAPRDSCWEERSQGPCSGAALRPGTAGALRVRAACGLQGPC